VIQNIKTVVNKLIIVSVPPFCLSTPVDHNVKKNIVSTRKKILNPSFVVIILVIESIKPLEILFIGFVIIKRYILFLLNYKINLI
jgi:hypothetical protein